MILVRQVFQIKFNQMDKVLGALQQAMDQGADSGGVSRVLTDISGKNFTLVFETKAESLDAFWQDMQERFQDAESAEQMNIILPYIESGHREFYTIEYEAGN